MAQSPTDAQVLLAVPRYLVKTIKDALQNHKRLDKSTRIKPFCAGAAKEAFCFVMDENNTNNSEEKYLIPTTVRIRTDADEAEKLGLKTALVNIIGAYQYSHSVSFYLRNLSPPGSSLPTPGSSQIGSLLGQVINIWLLSLPAGLLPLSISDLVSVSPWSYVIYHPLLLLPQNTFSTPPWPGLLSTTLRPHLPALYMLLCTHLKTTHIALNAPISAFAPGTPNILRKPQDLTPLHGSFGPSLSLTHVPSSADFEAAFWCTVRQNGIFQTWAPRHTMFSRGNISEKTRLLGLKTLTAEGIGSDPPSAISAVDLYAGIGYFAFCYAKLGVSKILCWELSRWSVEGLRRGAIENGWSIEVFDEEAKDIIEAIEAKQAHKANQLLIFQENNQNATQRITPLRSHIPPIRHVNCGFLPTSQASWATAARALDPVLGGWIHVHENIEQGVFEKRTEEIVREFRDLLNRRRRWGTRRGRGGRSHGENPDEEVLDDHLDDDDDDTKYSPVVEVETAELEKEDEEEEEDEEEKEKEKARKNNFSNFSNNNSKMIVQCIHFEKVKSYAPGIMHCVLDIAVLPLHSSNIPLS